jgi:hypothetical protein
MDNQPIKTLVAKMRSQRKTFPEGATHQTVSEVTQAFDLILKERETYIEMIRLAQDAIKSKDDKIAELEKQLKPNIFWTDVDVAGFDTAHEAIETMIDEINAKVGSVFTLDRGIRLLKQDYVLTEFDEDAGSFEYEALKEQGE